MKKYLVVLCCLLSLVVTSVGAAPDIRPEIVDLLKPKLNSDRIEYFFGSYGVDKLDIDSPIFPFCRVANLYSIHDGIKVMRTLAIVDFVQPVSPDLQEAHREIMKGKSIGIALRDQGWTVHKSPVFFGMIYLSPNLMDWMKETQIIQGALHIYNLEVSKSGDSNRLSYCTIMEVHSPQYLTTEWLKSLYEDQYEAYSVRTKEIFRLLDGLNGLIHYFPSRN